jgi:large subunit ribosomal protein L29
MKPSELRGKSVDELMKELEALRRAQFGLRMQKATQSLTKNSEVPRLKREIAQIHTVLTEKKRSQP